MAKNTLVITSLLLAALLSACSTVAPQQTTVTFIGNSGFLVTIGDNKILIDGIFKGFAPEYTQPNDIVELIKDAQPPFDHIDLILATHAHDDHFKASRVADYLADNPKTLFISTTEAANQVIVQNDGLGGRVTGISLNSGGKQELEANAIRVVAYDISHGYGPNGETFPNLGFLVEVNGVKIFHSGDMDTSVVTVTYLKGLGLPQEQIDIAFLQHFLFSDVRSLSFAREGVAARYYVPIHYNFTTPPIDVALIARLVPDAILFEKELDSWVMP